ncbi:DsbA family protein [Roseibium aggregatum]|uniref:Thioredoxin domain-containing protein n=1 Tax=Roseibium aggregatum TaxID=187304 RepID=A0A926P5B3_9HYPH|nr:thioredoxin domain-containing protein [Roseibium aggregatum]MBD1547562.1 thioredoxin domain-containing protein [Roseibium aggregatum]
MTLSRRQLLQAASGLALTIGIMGLPALAQAAETVDIDELMKPSPLGDKVLGSEDAPVTIVEYASMTCGHCAHFDEVTFPELKSRYIETGKVRYIFREYPLNQPAYAMSMLARCMPADKYFDGVEIMFEQLRSGALSGTFLPALTKLSKQIGFTQESFEECLTNQKLLDALEAEKTRATNEFGVKATPTFFINGEKHSGALSIEEMGKIIDEKM